MSVANGTLGVLGDRTDPEGVEQSCACGSPSASDPWRPLPKVTLALLASPQALMSVAFGDCFPLALLASP
jgi:hypothetical protein